jgi:hypothetical protein
MYLALNGMLVNGQNVRRVVMVESNRERCLVTIVMLVNVWQQVGQIVPIIVVNYHARNGQLPNGQNALSLVIMEHKQELSDVTITMLVIALQQISQTVANDVVLYHVPNGL